MPVSLRAGCARRQGGVCRGARVTPCPGLRSRARSRPHMLLIKSSAWLQRQPQPRPGAGVSHTRSPCPPPGAPAQLGNKINPKVSMGAMREGGSKRERAPGGEKGVLFPFAGEELAGVSSLPAPHPPHPFTLPTSSSAPQSSPSSPTLPPLAPPGAAQSSSWATSSSPSPGVPQLGPHSPPPSPQRLPGHTRRGLRESLSLHHPDVGKLPASLSLSFAICEMGAQGFDSIVLMFSYGTIPLGCDILGQPRDTRGIPTDHLPLSTGR